MRGSPAEIFESPGEILQAIAGKISQGIFFEGIFQEPSPVLFELFLEKSLESANEWSSGKTADGLPLKCLKKLLKKRSDWIPKLIHEAVIDTGYLSMSIRGWTPRRFFFENVLEEFRGKCQRIVRAGILEEITERISGVIINSFPGEYMEEYLEGTLEEFSVRNSERIVEKNLKASIEKFL